MNIASLVVRTKPECRAQVVRALGVIPGVEIAYDGDAGPLIVTVEDTPKSSAIDSMGGIHRLPGVIAASLSYHYSDDSLENA